MLIVLFVFYQKLSTCLTAHFWRMKIYKCDDSRCFFVELSPVFWKNKIRKTTNCIYFMQLITKNIDQNWEGEKGNTSLEITPLYLIFKCVNVRLKWCISSKHNYNYMGKLGDILLYFSLLVIICVTIRMIYWEGLHKI